MPREKEEELVFTNKVDEHYMLQKRNKVRLEKRIRSNAWILRLLFVACLSGYLFSDFSKVKCINVVGNEVYTKEYLVEDSGLTLNSIYYLFSPRIVASKLKKNELIKNVSIYRSGDNIVSIKIEEKKVVASYMGEELNYLCGDGSKVKVDQSNLSYMSKVPYIYGLEANEGLLVKLAKQLENVNSDVLNMMSEIVWYPLDYDESQLKVNMVDQNYVFVAVNDIALINDYRKIATTLSESGQCVYFDSNATHAYLSECLFNIVEEEEAITENSGN